MRAMTYGAALLLAGACLLGCGDDGAPAKKRGSSGESTVAKPVERAWGVVMTFDLDLERARKQGRIEEDAEDADVLAQVMDVVHNRLRTAKAGEYGMKASGASGFEVGFADLELARRDEVVALITRNGTLEFRIEVLPDKEYAKRHHGISEEPTRKGIWPGSAAAFEQFKKDEVAAWKRALAADEPYVPSRPGFRLVRAVDTDGSSPGHFHVLEEPAPEESFDGRIVRDSVLASDVMENPVVVFDVHNEWQNPFELWTARNLQMPMALVVDGEWYSAPVIQARLRAIVQITLGRGSREEIKREAVALAAVLSAGALPLRPRLLSIREP